MKRFSGPLLASSFFIAMSMAGLACGGDNQRELSSISLSPAVADAKDYSGGVVTFTAMGHYSKAPTDASLMPALWAVLPITGQEQSATITTDGHATCSNGAVGTFPILAYAPADPNIPLTNSGLLSAKQAVLGTAQLTCP